MDTKPEKKISKLTNNTEALAFRAIILYEEHFHNSTDNQVISSCGSQQNNNNYLLQQAICYIIYTNIVCELTQIEQNFDGGKLSFSRSEQNQLTDVRQSLANIKNDKSKFAIPKDQSLKLSGQPIYDSLRQAIAIGNKQLFEKLFQVWSIETINGLVTETTIKKSSQNNGNSTSLQNNSCIQSYKEDRQSLLDYAKETNDAMHTFLNEKLAASNNNAKKSL